MAGSARRRTSIWRRSSWSQTGASRRQPLEATNASPIQAIATGNVQARADGDPAAASTAATTAGRGLTVTGQVKNYVPVTDAMLLNPEAGDWLMIRRDYHASSYSPLAQINAGNVKNLRLVWEWAMNDGGGANEPTPIVHNGIIFLANTGNMVQAIDGRTGDLIWENRIGPDSDRVHRRDAQSGALSRQSVHGDHRCANPGAGRAYRQNRLADPDRGSRQRGYTNTSGPIVIRGKIVQGLSGCDQYKKDGCFISAYDPETGKQLWRFDTVAREE